MALSYFIAQVGEYSVVIEVGSKLLDTWESRHFRRDILLSMALAHCGLAAEAFSAGNQVCICLPPVMMVWMLGG
jgi:hypothetical protein